MRRKFIERLKFSKPKGPGFGISSHYYLSVLTGSAVLPILQTVMNPKGEDGAIPGFAVPLAPGSDKSALKRPMERGAYAFASNDQKTLIKIMVLSKEEAGFDPEVYVRAAGLQAEPELIARIRTTWQLIQLTFESHDPEVWPAIDLYLKTAQRLAELTSGVVADPVSMVYKLPADVLSEREQSQKFSIFDVVWPHLRPTKDGSIHVYTMGLSKFGMSELEFVSVKEPEQELAARFLMSLANQMLTGLRLDIGDTVGSKESAFSTVEGGLNREIWNGISCIEIIPQSGDLSAGLRKWEEGL